jgi:lysophospholipase L1-like esterase
VNKHHHPEYYLALGGSLSRGSQPNANGKTFPTNRGYTNDLYAAEKSRFKRLQLIELGCPGETTTSMIKGGTCGYAAGSQLASAVQFLHAHKRHIAFITIDIGGNDMEPCFAPTQILKACFQAADTTIRVNLRKIARRLRRAAGKKVPIVGMTYYDPALASWFDGKQGRKFAEQTQPLVRNANGDIAAAFRFRSIEVAPVANAFHTYESLTKKKQLYDHQRVPGPVAVLCKKTWMCAAPPMGPNDHANTAGYRKIANVFKEEKL